MPSLEPIDYNPFSEKGASPRNKPVLEAIDYDPFEGGTADRSLGPVDDAKTDIQEVAPVKEQSLVNEIAGDFVERYQNVQQAERELEAGERSPARYGTRLAGQTLGFGADVVESSVGAAYKAIPEWLRKPVEATAKAGVELAGKLPVGFGGEGTLGEAIPQEVGMLAENYEGWKAENPEAAEVFEDIMQVPRLAADVVGVGQGARVGYQAGKAGAQKVASGAREGFLTTKAGLKPRDRDALENSIEAIKADAGKNYAASEAMGARINQNAAMSMYRDMANLIPDADSAASRTLYGPLYRALDDFKSDIAAGDVGLQTLDRHRQIFGNLAKDITNPNKAQVAQKADDLINAMDERVARLSDADITGSGTEALDALEMGRKQWAKAKNFEKIAEILNKVEGDPRKLRKEAQKLLNNKKKMMGFNEAERAAIANIAKSNNISKAVDFLSKFGLNNQYVFTKGIGLGAVAATTGMGPFAALLGAGTAAGKGAKIAGAGRAERLLKAIEDRDLTPSARPQAPPEQPLALPAPDKARTMREQGFIRQEAGTTPILAEASGKATRESQLLELGITPDIKEAQFKNNLKKGLGEKWDAADAAQKAQYEQQIDDAWNSWQKDLKDVIRIQQAKRQTARRDAGIPQDQSTAMEDAFRRLMAGQ